MRLRNVGVAVGVLAGFGLAAGLTFQFKGSGGLWRGLEPALGGNTASAGPKTPYDLTKLEAVNETLRLIRDKYVEPQRVRPKDMLLAALNRVQQDVAQVIVLQDEGSPDVTIRVETAEKKFRIDNVQAPWDIAVRLREIFAFVQENLKNADLDMHDVEYAACNGMLHTLDPHSVFLSPEAYKDMNTSTQGAFGGLGIVISIRDHQLTVMNPMPGTPAGRAGLRRLDRITKINNESTQNMPLDDAVRRLRGEPGTPVTVWVHRDGPDGWADSKPFELRRERIQVKSVDAKYLDGVGYIRLKQFQSNSAKEVEEALADFHKKDANMKGLVLDLRGNPGGLLEQAVKIADLFVREGILVATAGASEGREEKRAKGPGTEPDYPVVVLVNGSSASASEIVAGALKNLDRALIVGQTTFGKGSVQLVFSDLTPEKAALKLTIAQYLTPGDVSIQSVGIPPDIELDPMTVDSLEMDLFSNKKVLRERDLSAHLSNAKAKDGQKPTYSVGYYMPESERAAIRDRGGDIDETKFEADFPIRFAKELATKIPFGSNRPAALRSVHDAVTQTQKDELGRASDALSKIGIDWSDTNTPDVGPTSKDFEVSVTTDRSNNTVTAGDSMTLKVTVKNNGKDPVHRLRATTISDSGYYDGKELVFGKIKPGESKTATVPFGWCEVEGRKPGSSAPTPTNAPRVCKIPKDAISREDGVKVHFESAGDHAPTDAEIRPTLKALERPAFSYAYEIIDNRNSANGDGRLQRGEGATVYLVVKNVGTGVSSDTQASLRNLSGDGVLLGEARFDLAAMHPNETRRIELTFDVLQSLPLEENEIKLELSVSDRDLREYASEKIKLAIDAAGKLEPGVGPVKPKGLSALLYESPSATARAFGSLASGVALQSVAKVGDFYKVELPASGASRFAFVATKDVEQGGTPSTDPKPFEDLLVRSPPLIEFNSAALSTKEGKIKVNATATDNDRILDVYMFVNSKKVFYKSNRSGGDPKKVTMEFDAPLRPGINVVRFFARENNDTVSSRAIVIRRDGANGELLPTPKTDDQLFEGVEE